MKILSMLTWTLCLALLVATPRLSPAQGVDPDNPSEVASHMHEHLERISEIKKQIIRGNLDGVNDPATWLAEHESVSGLPKNFEPYVELMRNYAHQVLAAPDLSAAAVAVSRMARTCGNCHLVNEIEIEFSDEQTPADWSDTITHMQRHQWAADRLWEGLIAPSDTAWSRGTDMLVDVPLGPTDVLDGTTSVANATAIDEIARRVHLLGGQGTNTRTPDSRSVLYGEILGLCADCHSMLESGPKQ